MRERTGFLPDEPVPEFGVSPFQPIRPTDDYPRADLPIWTFHETIRGALLTLVPWLALAALNLLSSSQTTPSKPLSPGVDIANAIFIFIVQVLLEGTFLIAPLWYAVFKPRRIAKRQGLLPPPLRQGFGALGFRAFRSWQGVAGVVLGVAGIYAVSVLYTLIAQAFNMQVQTNVDVLSKQAAVEPWTILATLVAAVIVAPLCEETFFRSYFFQGLRLRLSVWVAMILSAIIFGIAHGDPGSLVLLIVIGIFLALLRWRTRSIWPGICLHMLNNLLSALFVFQMLQFH